MKSHYSVHTCHNVILRGIMRINSAMHLLVTAGVLILKLDRKLKGPRNEETSNAVSRILDCIATHPAYDVRTTLYGRCYNVVLTLCVCWVHNAVSFL